MRYILHCDLNAFFASVECVKNSSLKSVPMAVCGDPDIRHGIILAKNELAKKMGVITAETIYSAQKKCRDLVLVKENYEDYLKYSRLVNNIYLKYTDRVEPYGIDEAFLDITGSIKLFGSPYNIAYKIKEEIKRELGLTISVGISFNKSLAKLGSDLKKPDAISVINYENFKEIINSLPVNSLLYIGKRTNNILNKLGIYTIGDLSRSNKDIIISKLGKNGEQIYNYSNGIDNSVVRKFTDIPVPKSISKSMTFEKDILDIEEMKYKIRYLADKVATNLRIQGLSCKTVSLHLKDNLFTVVNHQKVIKETNLFQDISNNAIEILNTYYIYNRPIRAIGVSTSSLVSKLVPTQLCIFDKLDKDTINKDKLKSATLVVDNIRGKYGQNMATFASLMNKNKSI